MHNSSITIKYALPLIQAWGTPKLKAEIHIPAPLYRPLYSVLYSTAL